MFACPRPSCSPQWPRTGHRPIGEVFAAFFAAEVGDERCHDKHCAPQGERQPDDRPATPCPSRPNKQKQREDSEHRQQKAEQAVVGVEGQQARTGVADGTINEVEQFAVLFSATQFGARLGKQSDGICGSVEALNWSLMSCSKRLFSATQVESSLSKRVFRLMHCSRVAEVKLKLLGVAQT